VLTGVPLVTRRGDIVKREHETAPTDRSCNEISMTPTTRQLDSENSGCVAVCGSVRLCEWELLVGKEE
jgi:hypothetical protein